MNLFAIRRERLIKDIVGDACIILFSGKAVNRSEDESYPFSVNRNFYYLTGIDAESMALVIQKIDGNISEAMYILPYDEYMAKWVGGRMREEEVSEISGVQNVQDLADLDGAVAMTLNRTRHNPDFKAYFDLWCYDSDQALTPALNFVSKLKEKHPSLIIKDIYPQLTKMRMIKDDYEITCIKRALEITNAGVRKMMASIKPGLNEMTMQGVFEFVLAQNVCHQTAFDTIAASGERATILHYHQNNQEIKDGEMFLCDLGATFKNYCADISRTFPANGRFSDRQRELYEIVLHVQKLVEENARPGVTLRQLNNLVVSYYKEELPKHGLTKDVSEYYWHGVSHHLGLDTHDVSIGNAPLEAGNVITNEPGLYIAEEGIGIRIEDDLLITGTGCENLACNVPKTVEEIEQLNAR